MAPQVEGPAQLSAEAIEEECHADVLAALQRVGERQEARGGHAIPGVRVRAAQVESHEAADDARQHHEKDAHHEKRRENGRHRMLAIRLRRAGSTRRPFFRVVVTESSAPREGRFVEVIGHYNPRTQPETLHLERERLEHWIKAGAQPSDTVRTLVDRMPPPAPAAEAAAAPVSAPVAEPGAEQA